MKRAIQHGELEFVSWLAEKSRQAVPGCGIVDPAIGPDVAGPRVRLGIGDDMAELAAPGGAFLISSDMLLDGVHFDATAQSLEAIGRKAVACSLSDCAAMAVRPVGVVISVALSAAMTLDDAKRLYEGMFAQASEFDADIVGGDTTRWGHPLAIDVAVTAEPYPGIRPIRRDGARAGDGVFVTGPLGGSILGKHLNFTPRVREARALAEALGDRLHAMIDITDGLSLDLYRVCRASGVGACLDERLLEAATSDDARRLAVQDGRPPLEHVLSDGEDYELLVIAEGDIQAGSPVGGGSGAKGSLIRVGEIIPAGFDLIDRTGRQAPLQPSGYTHF